MGNRITSLVGFALGLILVYILVSNSGGTVPIASTVIKGIPPVVSSLQGVGPGYPKPNR